MAKKKAQKLISDTRSKLRWIVMVWYWRFIPQRPTSTDSKGLIPLLEKLDNERIKKVFLPIKAMLARKIGNILKEENPRTGYSIKHREISH